MKKSLILLNILILVGIVLFFYLQEDRTINTNVPLVVTQKKTVNKTPKIEPYEVILDHDIALDRTWIYTNEKYAQPFSIDEIEKKTSSDFELRFSLLSKKNQNGIDGFTFAIEKKF